jgi:hypothetical protein
MDINKGWREQLSQESQEKIKIWAEGVVRQWHDDVKPDYIFLTETGAIPYGFVLKETWKKAYGRENAPKFYRVDPVPLIRDEEKDGGHISKFFTSRIKKESPRILVFDEGNARDGKWSSSTEEDFLKTTLKRYSPSDIGRAGASSLYAVMKKLYNSLENQDPIIWGSQQAVGDILLNAEETNLQYKARIHENIFLRLLAHIGYPLGLRSRSPTSKGEKSNPRYRTEDELFSAKRIPFEKIRGNIVKQPKQRRRALDYVRDLKEIGREAGEELHTELEQEAQKKKSLEQRVSLVIAIAGLVSIFFFLGSGITGNAVGNLNNNSGAYIGIILFLIGLLGIVVYFKRK